jgi:hypothetical protein
MGKSFASHGQSFRRRYAAADIGRLAQFAAAHRTCLGRRCRRGCTMFSDARLQRLAEASDSYVTLCASAGSHRRINASVLHTQASQVAIAQRLHPGREVRLPRVDTIRFA